MYEAHLALFLGTPGQPCVESSLSIGHDSFKTQEDH